MSEGVKKGENHVYALLPDRGWKSLSLPYARTI